MKILLPIVLGSFFAATGLQAASPTNSVVHPNAPASNSFPTASNNLSPAEWQQLRAARMAALKANPSLVAKSAQLSEKLRQFEQKLNAAMVKTDPKVAPVLAKFSGNRPPITPNSPPPAKTQ